jgi:hypothetical protein
MSDSRLGATRRFERLATRATRRLGQPWMAEPGTPETAQLPASPAATRRQPPPAAPARVGEGARARHSPPAAGYRNDVYRFSPAANAWTALSPSGSAPSGRHGMGFAATPDGMLYVFGGYDGGTEGGGVGVIGLHGASCAGRCRAAEGARVGREETCTCACMSAARHWATHTPLARRGRSCT